MATLYWVNGDADGLWNNANNWDNASGGAGGDGVPGVADTAVFDDQCLDNCTVNANVAVTSISNTVAGGLYTGTFTFTTHTATITGALEWAGGSLIMGTGTWTCSGDIVLGAGVLTTTTGKLVILGNSAITSAGNRFYNVDLGTAAATASSITASDNLYIKGALAVKNGAATTLDITGFTLSVEGAFNLTNLDTWTDTGSRVEILGKTPQTVTTAGNTIVDLTVVNPSSTTFAGDVTVTAFHAFYPCGNIYFAASSTVTFTTSEILGRVGNEILLASGTGGTAFTLISAGFDYKNIRVRDCTGSGQNFFASEGNCINEGGNTKWDFRNAELAIRNIPAPAKMRAIRK